MRFPDTKPAEDPAALWKLQQELLREAESVLGPRDRTKKIYQPEFKKDGPRLRNTPKTDGVFAELGLNAETDWAVATFQLAHETVHLLDPHPGDGNNLEEGVATAFVDHIQSKYGTNVRDDLKSYKRTLDLAQRLPCGALKSGRLIRAEVGSLADATLDVLMQLFPQIDAQILKDLVAPFVRT